MKKIVVKVGSSVIAPHGKLDSFLITRIVKDILEAERKGYGIVLVSSGAIACGLNKLGYKKFPQDIHSLMAFSSLGQVALMNIYAEKFKKYKKLCAQILLTWDDFDNRKRFINARCTIDKLFAMGIIPIINENDAVSYEEIRFGDNDRLSALVSDLIRAEALIILSDVEGLLENDNVIRMVPQIDAKILSLAKSEDKTHTRGGMITKLEAAKIAASSGIKTIIAHGGKSNVICRIIAGEGLGTLFLAQNEIARARKRWIAFSKKMKGKVFIDEGASQALLNRGKSLLSVGIIRIEGSFKRGDAVCIVDKEDRICGCGIINYSSDELSDFKGKKFEKEIIHRDNFVKRG
ncbi:MAG: glutamate 5-kinase [Candidatus Omnitrophica bacterium]|nr:glutamate 5-kinase [Candidatus Omnitrophota bacterium]MBU0896476.1 glutamate 5-kinase [Candidatus Omnitrophota bacterium]MBU1134665.1 glutamate 5-kinase [Candidatus Omnitrophota bacterium]MBU1810298.1 glutamate 5-kinase [Candidatus Omnitrophota bacterium]MBU2504726.1 glutamate 5-kinase [Candidatus Omnitrophota bacterium]